MSFASDKYPFISLFYIVECKHHICMIKKL